MEGSPWYDSLRNYLAYVGKQGNFELISASLMSLTATYYKGNFTYLIIQTCILFVANSSKIAIFEISVLQNFASPVKISALKIIF